MTSNMQQLTFLGTRRLEWRDVTPPVLQDAGQAIVRPIASTTCDIDHWIIQGEFPFDGPFAIGHECVAEVVDVGDRVRTVRPGDVVVVPWHISCGSCDRCRSGRPAHCRATAPTAGYGIPFGGSWGGTFDELVRVPYADAMLVTVPAGIDPVTVAAAGDNLTIPIELLGHHLRDRPGATVLVLGRHGLGSGSVSLFAADVAAALGASRVVYIDADPERRAIAERIRGVETDTGPPRRDLGRFDIVFDCSTSARALQQAMRLLTPDGIVECPGGHYQPVELDLFHMYTRGVTFHTGIANAHEHINAAFNLVLDGRIQPQHIMEPPQPIDHAPERLVEPSLKPVFVRPRMT